MTIHNWSKEGKVVMGRSDEFQELKPHHKLLLHPLSDMTEEEDKEWQKIYDEMNEYVSGAEGYAEQVRYLCSKSFDLFSLIPEGLAIDATTIKQ